MGIQAHGARGQHATARVVVMVWWLELCLLEGRMNVYLTVAQKPGLIQAAVNILDSRAMLGTNMGLYTETRS